MTHGGEEQSGLVTNINGRVVAQLVPKIKDGGEGYQALHAGYYFVI